MKDVMTALARYLNHKTFYEFVKDMKIDIGNPGKEAYAMDKFVLWKRDPLSFYFQLDNETKEKFDEAVLEFAATAPGGHEKRFTMDIAEGTVELEIVVAFDHEFDSSYGADADGNRGVPTHFIEINGWKAYQNGKIVNHKLLKEFVGEIEEEIKRMDSADEFLDRVIEESEDDPREED